MLTKLLRWKEDHEYLLFLDNWHKWPPLSRLLCRLGRHDFEFEDIEKKEGVEWAKLECFYCGKKRFSSRSKL